MNVTHAEIVSFMEKVNETFPTDGQHNHCLVLSKSSLLLNIWTEDKWWQVDLDNEEEWRNPNATLEQLKSELK